MFLYPHCYTPTPEAQEAAKQLMERVRTYRTAHPESELNQRGKMFGVLTTEEGQTLAAFSGLLDGSYHHPGFVAPIYEINPATLVGKDRDDSRQKQEWLFRQYRLRNAQGEEKDLLEIFADETQLRGLESRVPSGAGECCAPKLLQAAYLQGLHPKAMAEFWMGASPKDEIRVEGQFYPACIGKCRPILRHMLTGIEVQENPLLTLGRNLAQKTKICYEDNHLVVISKPSGLLSVPGRDGQYCLVDYLHEQYRHQEGGTEPAFLQPAHRLDQDTSGLLVVAKNESAYKEMQALFVAHQVEKMYVAEVVNSQSCSMAAGQGTIDLPLIANPLDRPRQIVDWQHGKRAVTHWQTASFENMKHRPDTDVRRIELYPETGRTHQLRVHCAHPDGLNAPIVGDRLYGFGAQQTLRLHATRLHFLHPITGEQIDLTDYPDWW